MPSFFIYFPLLGSADNKSTSTQQSQLKLSQADSAVSWQAVRFVLYERLLHFSKKNVPKKKTPEWQIKISTISSSIFEDLFLTQFKSNGGCFNGKTLRITNCISDCVPKFLRLS